MANSASASRVMSFNLHGGREGSPRPWHTRREAVAEVPAPSDHLPVRALIELPVTPAARR